MTPTNQAAATLLAEEVLPFMTRPWTQEALTLAIAALLRQGEGQPAQGVVTEIERAWRDGFSTGADAGKNAPNGYYTDEENEGWQEYAAALTPEPGEGVG